MENEQEVIPKVDREMTIDLPYTNCDVYLS